MEETRWLLSCSHHAKRLDFRPEAKVLVPVGEKWLLLCSIHFKFTVYYLIKQTNINWGILLISRFELHVQCTWLTVGFWKHPDDKDVQRRVFLTIYYLLVNNAPTCTLASPYKVRCRNVTRFGLKSNPCFLIFPRRYGWTTEYWVG